MLRVVLKISGEYLGGKKGFGIDYKIVDLLTEQIKNINDKKKNIEIAIIIGGGNFFRGADQQKLIERSAADNAGMLATVMNGLFLQSALEKKKQKTRLMSSIAIHQVAEPYIQRRAIRHLEKGRIVILSAGLGAPYFSTDTAAVVRAKEIDADLVVKGTKVDGVYNKDPVKYQDAEKFISVTYDEMLKQNIKIMDSTSITFSQENKIPIYVLDITSPRSLTDFFESKYPGTSIKADNADKRIEEILKKGPKKKKLLEQILKIVEHYKH